MNFENQIIQSLNQLLAPSKQATRRSKAGSGKADLGAVFARCLDDLELGIWIIDPDYRIVGMNAQAARLHGQDAAGRFCYAVARGAETACDVCPARSVFEGRPGGRAQHRRRTEPGNHIYLDHIATPIKDDHGNVAGAMILNIDVTRQSVLEEEVLQHRTELEQMVRSRTRELEEIRKGYHGLYERHRKGEALFRSLLDSSPDAIVIVDLKGNVKYVNVGFTDLFGWRLEEVKGKRVPFVPKPEEAASVVEILRVIEKGERSRSFPTRRYTKDGRLLDVYLSASRYEDHQGKPVGMMVILKDVTRLRELEMQLYRSQRMEAIGTLASGIAHDFNNLMMGMQGNISLLKFDLEGNRDHLEKLDKIEKHVHQGVGLTRQLLGLAKVGAYEVQPTDLNMLLENSVEMFGRTKKEIVIERGYQEGIWTVDVDPGQIEQVLLNLFVNAWQAMPGGGRIILKTENIRPDGQFLRLLNLRSGKYVKITVADTGAGIDQAIVGKIFDPFFTTKHQDRGTGLGLASAFRIVSNHRGMIDVESEPGKGTSFFIYLPASGSSVATENISENAPRTGKETIMLVDDEKMVADVTCQLLEKLGYHVLTAYSGEEALAVYETHQEAIDLVILDIVMPGLSGDKTFERLRKLNPRLNVLLCSGYSLNGQAENLLARGCRDFIQKPFDITNLSQKIRSIIER
jgi:two-component system, cell cycle sensor histidine kinase and response regulator CckA